MLNEPFFVVQKFLFGIAFWRVFFQSILLKYDLFFCLQLLAKEKLILHIF